jgi:hypothetical protein
MENPPSHGFSGRTAASAEVNLCEDARLVKAPCRHGRALGALLFPLPLMSHLRHPRFRSANSIPSRTMSWILHLSRKAASLRAS